jgi:PEP-CTERM motif-containing protein
MPSHRPIIAERHRRHGFNLIATIAGFWLLAGIPAMANTFGVSLSSTGSAGDACQLPAQIDAEGFSSGSLTGNYSLNYSGSAVGYNNGYPNSPTDATATGCVYSPVFANVSANGTAALGVLKASAAADMTSPLVFAQAGITEGWNDTFTAVSGGTYVITFSLNAIDNASPVCPEYPGPLTSVIFGNEVLIPGTNFTGLANWNYNDCNASTQEPYAYGATALNSDTVQVTIGLAAGAKFTVSSSLQIGASAGYAGQSSSVNASNTAYADIVGENGATYTSASGATYSYSDSGTPEPASWLLAGSALAAAALRVRRRFRPGRPAAA